MKKGVPLYNNMVRLEKVRLRRTFFLPNREKTAHGLTAFAWVWYNRNKKLDREGSAYAPVS